MSHRPFVGLMALGPIDPEILRRLTAIAKFFPAGAGAAQTLPHASRGGHQYHSTSC
jgi:hypothetical protein